MNQAEKFETGKSAAVSVISTGCFEFVWDRVPPWNGGRLV